MLKTTTEKRTLIPLIAAISTLLLMLALSFFSLLTYRHDLQNTLSEMTRRDLEKSNRQSVLLFQNIIHNYFLQLDTVAQFASVNSGTGDSEIAALMHRSNEEDSKIRFGISGPDGILCTGGEFNIDISQETYFAQALKGERVISDVLKSGSSESDVIVFAVPIWNDGQIVGVACSQYDIQLFTDLLGNSQFEGKGVTMVMQQNGHMVSSYPGMEAFDTFYEALEPMEFTGSDTLKSLETHITRGDSGFFTYYRDGKARYLYYSPTGIRDYVMLSLVMAESMEETAHEIRTQAFILTLKSIFFYSVIVICVWAISLLIRKLMHYYQKDPLTQTYNKISAQKTIEHFINGPGRKKVHALLFLDIDNFKSINDSYGHAEGDQLLIALSKALQANFRSGDIISRFGGDEFLIFMENLPSPEVAEKKAGKLCSLLICGQKPYSATVSIGFACYPEDGCCYHDLLKHADQALYSAKAQGKNQFQRYRQE